MGGNALKDFGVERLNKEDFSSLQEYIKRDLDHVGFHLDDIHFIKSYKDKEDFGDMDIIINRGYGAGTETLVEYLEGKTYVKNSHCYSVLYKWKGKKFQVDFITEECENFKFASHYFDYNDLGNLIGRIAHKAGFKFGHDGLWYVVRDGDYKVGDICLTKDFKEAIEFLGLSWVNYEYGFTSLESIFKFVSSSPFFDPSSYSLENRSHNARIRDKKRPTYRAFLKWLEESKVEPGFAVKSKEEWLEYAWTCWPDAKEKYTRLTEKNKIQQEVAMKFNGHIVMELTPLRGEELGEFMRCFKHEIASSLLNVNQWIISTPQEDIDSCILSFYNDIWCKRG